MRPPLGTSDLKQNEVIRHHYNQQHHQLAQEYTKISSEDKLNTNHLTQQPPPPHLRHTILHEEHLKRAEISLTNSTSLVETPNDLFRSYLITPKANVHNKSVGVPKPTSVQVANLHKKRKSLDLAHTSSSLNSLSSDENIDENVAANFHIKYPTAAADHHTLNVNFPDNSINIINAPSVSEHEPLLLTANYSRHTESNNSLKAQIYQHPPLVTAASDQSTLKYLQKQQQRHSLQFINNNTSEGCDTRSFRTPSQDQFLLSAVNVPCTTTAAVTRKQHAYSWYAPVYSALEEEFDQSSRDSSPIHNLANTKNSALTQHHNRYTSESATTALDRETVALLESRNLINNRSHHATLKNPPNTLSLKVAAEESDALADTKQTQRSDHLPNSTEFKYDIESSHASSFGLTGGPLPRRRRFENFIKSLVGLRASARTPTTSSTPSASSETNEFTLIPQSKPGSPEITLTRSPSINMPDVYENGYESMRSGEQLAILQPELTTASTSSLNVVQQKLRHMLRREGSAASLRQEHSQSIVQYRGLRKCETVLALTRQPQTSYAPIMRNSRSNGVINARGVEQIRPLNRLRHSINNMNAMTCTRCSSLISLAAANSRYSLNVYSHGFRNSDIGGMLLTRLQNNNTSNNNNNNSNCIKSLQAESTSRHSLSVGASSDSNAIKNNMKYIPVGKTRAANNKHDNTDSTVLISAGNQENDESSSKSNINISNTNSNNNNNDPLSVTKETNKAIISLLSSDDEPDGDKNTKYNSQIFEIFTCKLCLIDVESEAEATTLLQCNCQFCTECLRAYIDFEITEGAYEISCPDAQCPTQGRITLPEIAFLTTPNLMKKHHRYRLNREIELDKTRTWCPRAGCETVCIVRSISSAAGMSAVSPSTSYAGSAPTDEKITQGFVAVRCPSCNDEFCAACKKTWHPNISCEEHSRRLVADGQDDIGIPFDNDMIKCCPMCAVPIEKDEGCAQMMCKRCKHVFCWYCLASLDDDFLLRHYDKGPCKNKLGHSRASVVWHRAQVIGIFAGFGILLLVASPLLLLAAPCIICCKCRSCSGSKIDEVDPELDDAAALQR